MALHFEDVTPEDLEKFFVNLIVSDMSMPHTKQRLSPITFCEFLTRNQIQILNPFELYDAANKVWCKFNNQSTNLFNTEIRKKVDLEPADTVHPGWDMFIDYLNRFLDVTKIEFQYFQMHYIAHVCNNFIRDTEDFEEIRQIAYRNTWHNLLDPIFYECIIPTKYAWLPIKNYADVRFITDLQRAVDNVKQFIQDHSGDTMNCKAYNDYHVSHIRKDCEDTISIIYKNKLKTQEEWGPALEEFLFRNQMREVDANLCEMWPQFKANGLKIATLFDKLNDFRRGYEDGKYDDDPESVIDKLLEIRPDGDAYEVDLTKVDFLADNDDKGGKKNATKPKHKRSKRS